MKRIKQFNKEINNKIDFKIKMDPARNGKVNTSLNQRTIKFFEFKRLQETSPKQRTEFFESYAKF